MFIQISRFKKDETKFVYYTLKVNLSYLVESIVILELRFNASI